jgi:hypothetical protein
MDTSKSAAERIRPILQAMERSIDSARRHRIHKPGHPGIPGTPGTPGNPGPVPSHVSGLASNPALSQPTVGQSEPRHTAANPTDPSAAPARLKAKPKRFGTFASPYDQPAYRSQTG